MIYSQKNVRVNNTNIVHYDKIDVSEGLMLIKQVDKRSAISFTIGSFKDKGFQTQLNVCNGCHDLLMLSVNVKDIDDVDKKSK